MYLYTVLRLKIERQLKRDKKKKSKSDIASPKATETAADDYSPPASPGYDYEDDSSAMRPVRKFESNDKSVKLNAIQRLKDERERKKQNG